MHSLKYVRYTIPLGKVSPWYACLKNEHFTQVFNGNSPNRNYEIVDEIDANEVTYDLLSSINHELLPYIPALWLFLHYMKENRYKEAFVCRCWFTYEDYFHKNDNYDIQLIQEYNFSKNCFVSIQGFDGYKVALPVRNPDDIIHYFANSAYLSHLDTLETDLSS